MVVRPELGALPWDVSFRKDDEIGGVLGCFADEADGFGDGCFGVEEDWGDVAGYTLISETS